MRLMGLWGRGKVLWTRPCGGYRPCSKGNDWGRVQSDDAGDLAKTRADGDWGEAERESQEFGGPGPGAGCGSHWLAGRSVEREQSLGAGRGAGSGGRILRLGG